MNLPCRIAAVAGLAALCQVAAAETYYRWTDSDGSARFTRSQPGLGFAYEAFEVPDPVRWLNAPDMPAEIGTDAGPTPQSFFKSVSKSVYGLTGKMQDESGHARGVVFGSAVAITDKLALTNCHVLEGAGEDIYLGAGETGEVEKARLVGANYEADRCVISVSRMDLHPVPGVRRFDAVEVGESVYAIGNPLKLDRTLSEGLLSGKRTKGEQRYLQTTAPISPGSSGGGLFDTRGNLIGITSFTLRGAQSLNFAIPAEDYWK